MLNDRPNISPRTRLHVAELARQADVTPAAIRYYARAGLLSPEREPGNGYRCFSSSDLHRVVFIRQAQSLGLTIGDIRHVLETIDQGGAPCHLVKSLVEERLVKVKQRLGDLRETETRIANALETWQTMHDLIPRSDEYCPLIERIVARGDEAPDVLESVPMNRSAFE